MLANTGTVSFILYGIFILMSISAMIITFYFIKRDTFPAEKLDRMIELFKYTIVTTSIATVTLVVTDLFKERDQDVKELEYFDKYVTDVKKADGVYERWQLSKYLSVVSPSGELKKSWKEYYAIVDKEYSDYLKLKSIQVKNDMVKDPSSNQLYNFEKIQAKINLLEKPIVGASAIEDEEWVIVTGGDKTLDAAAFELNKALKFNPNSKIEKKGDSYRTMIYGYHNQEEARKMLQTAKEKLNPTSYMVKRSTW